VHGDDPEHVDVSHYATMMPATPEFSPLRCPMYSSPASSSQDDNPWGESLPAAAMSAEQLAMWQYAAGQFWQAYSHDQSAGYAAEYYNAIVENQNAALCSVSDRASRHARPALPTIAEKEVPAVLAPKDSSMSETRTTVMLKGVPDTYTRSELLKLLDNEGFFGRFNFVYVPIDFKKQRNLGYALINLVSPKEAIRLSNRFEGFSNWSSPCDTVCEVAWCNPHQGLQAHVERYRNSPVMHESVPEEWRPLLLSHGVPIPFPEPTTKIKCPKLKGKQ